VNLRAVIRISLILIVAVFTGLLFRGLFVASSSKAPPPAKAAAGSMVAAAARDLSKGLLVREDDYLWREVAANQVVPTMIVKGSDKAKHLTGAVVRQEIAEGREISQRDLVFPDAPGFLAAVLAPGMRAVSVAIDDVTGNAGLILPGDRVDLLLTQKLDDQGLRSHKRVASEIVLSDLRVIAVGSQLQVNAADKVPSRPARTVTLEVTPQDAEKVSVATRLGQLSLALRSLASMRPGEAAASAAVAAGPKVPARPTWGEDVSMAVRQQEAGRHQTRVRGVVHPKPVQVFRGSHRQESGSQVAAGAAAASPPAAAGEPEPLR